MISCSFLVIHLFLPFFLLALVLRLYLHSCDQEMFFAGQKGVLSARARHYQVGSPSTADGRGGHEGLPPLV